jgi:hypothetical protein
MCGGENHYSLVLQILVTRIFHKEPYSLKKPTPVDNRVFSKRVLWDFPSDLYAQWCRKLYVLTNVPYFRYTVKGQTFFSRVLSVSYAYKKILRRYSYRPKATQFWTLIEVSEESTAVISSVEEYIDLRTPCLTLRPTETLVNHQTTWYHIPETTPWELRMLDALVYLYTLRRVLSHFLNRGVLFSRRYDWPTGTRIKFDSLLSTEPSVINLRNSYNRLGNKEVRQVLLCVESQVVWRWCTPLRITGGSDFVHCPAF